MQEEQGYRPGHRRTETNGTSGDSAYRPSMSFSPTSPTGAGPVHTYVSPWKSSRKPSGSTLYSVSLLSIVGFLAAVYVALAVLWGTHTLERHYFELKHLRFATDVSSGVQGYTGQGLC